MADKLWSSTDNSVTYKRSTQCCMTIDFWKITNSDIVILCIISNKNMAATLKEKWQAGFDPATQYVWVKYTITDNAHCGVTGIDLYYLIIRKDTRFV